MTKSKIFFWLLIAFIAGIAVASFLSFGIWAIAAVFISGGSVAAFGALRPAERQYLVVAGFAAVACAAGAFWLLRQTHMASRAFDGPLGRRIELKGMIAGDPVRRPRSQELLLERGSGGGAVRIILRPYPEYRYGDRLRVTGTVERDDNRRGFEMAFPDIAVVATGGGSPVYRMLLGLKHRFSDALSRHLPEPEGSFLTGLLLGERQNFPEALRRDLQITGTAHVVALSGYNITIVADALLKLSLLLFVPIGVAWWVTIAGIGLFTLLTGATASVVRAAIMGALVVIARRAGRVYHMRNALALAAVAMLIHDPSLLRLDIGFRLSFFATFGLLYLAPPVDGWLERVKVRLFLFGRDRRMLREERASSFGPPRISLIRATLVSTLAAQLAVLPLIVFYFGRLSFVAPFANLAILPLIPLTMFLGFSTGIASLLGDGVGRIAALASQLPLAYELSVIRWFAGLPAASIEIYGLGPVVLVGAYAFIGALVWRRRVRPP
ncbi:MAG: ComEC/Rec2 family competence protein [bacterium]|nr:ComEC/Rec2 family competence protein [bacterium]